MKIAVIFDSGEQDLAGALAAALQAQGAEAVLLDSGTPDSAGPTAELAHNLVAIESELASSPADGVALIGRGDAPFAGVLVATKIPLPAFWLDGAGDGGHGIDNAALIARLADHSVEGDAEAAAESISRKLGAS